MYTGSTLPNMNKETGSPLMQHKLPPIHQEDKVASSINLSFSTVKLSNEEIKKSSYLCTAIKVAHYIFTRHLVKAIPNLKALPVMV